MKNKKIGVYQILNLTNGKSYIGSSRCIYDRFYNHKINLNNNKNANTHLQLSWNMYGKDNFKFNILEECKVEELIEKEKKWVEIFNTTNPEKGYNKVIPGEEYKIAFRKNDRIKIRKGRNGEVINHPHNKSIVLINKITNEKEYEFPTISTAAKFLNSSDKRISECLNKKKGKKVLQSYKGYVIILKSLYDSKIDYRPIYKRKRNY